MYEVEKKCAELEDENGQKVIARRLYIKDAYIIYDLYVRPEIKRIEIYDYLDGSYSWPVIKDYSYMIEQLRVKFELVSKREKLLFFERNGLDSNDFVLVGEAIDKLLDQLLDLVVFYSKQLSKEENE